MKTRTHLAKEPITEGWEQYLSRFWEDGKKKVQNPSWHTGDPEFRKEIEMLTRIKKDPVFRRQVQQNYESWKGQSRGPSPSPSPSPEDVDDRVTSYFKAEGQRLPDDPVAVYQLMQLDKVLGPKDLQHKEHVFDMIEEHLDRLSDEKEERHKKKPFWERWIEASGDLRQIEKTRQLLPPWLIRVAGEVQYMDSLFKQMWPWILEQTAARVLTVAHGAPNDDMQTYMRRRKRLDEATALRKKLEQGRPLTPDDQKMLKYLAPKLGVSPDTLAASAERIKDYVDPREAKLKKLKTKIDSAAPTKHPGMAFWEQHYGGAPPKSLPSHSDREFKIGLKDIPYLSPKSIKRAQARSIDHYDEMIAETDRPQRKAQLQADKEKARTLLDGGETSVKLSYGQPKGGAYGSYVNTPQGQFMHIAMPSVDSLLNNPEEAVAKLEETVKHELRHGTQYNMGIVLAKPMKHKPGFPKQDIRSFERSRALTQEAKKKEKAQFKHLDPYSQYLLQDYEFYTWMSDEIWRFKDKTKKMDPETRERAFDIFVGVHGDHPKYKHLDPTGAIQQADVTPSQAFSTWKAHAPKKWGKATSELRKALPERPKHDHPKFLDFWEAMYDGGKKMVTNPNQQTKDRWPKVQASTAYKANAQFRHAIQKEFQGWLAQESASK